MHEQRSGKKDVHTTEDRHTLKDQLQDLKKRAQEQLDEGFDKYTIEDFDIAVNRIPHKTAQVTDQWTRSSLQALCS